MHAVLDKYVCALFWYMYWKCARAFECTLHANESSAQFNYNCLWHLTHTVIETRFSQIIYGELNTGREGELRNILFHLSWDGTLPLGNSYVWMSMMMVATTAATVVETVSMVDVVCRSVFRTWTRHHRCIQAKIQLSSSITHWNHFIRQWCLRRSHTHTHIVCVHALI